MSESPIAAIWGIISLMIVLALGASLAGILEYIQLGAILMYAGGFITLIALTIALFMIPSLKVVLKRGEELKNVKVRVQVLILLIICLIVSAIILSPFVTGAALILIAGYISNIKSIKPLKENYVYDK